MLNHRKTMCVCFYSTICTLLLHTNDLIRFFTDFISKWVTEETKLTKLTKWRRSRRALAVPATFMILFISLLGIVSITYYFAVERVNARSSAFKIATAKQDMLSFDENLRTTLWQPGSARTLEFADSDGELNVQPSANSLVINITDNQDVATTVFNGTIGQVVYELPYSETPETGLFLKGDSRAITNQSGSIITQLYIRRGVEHPELVLHYRPTTSYTTAGVENGKAVTNLRIYVVNLNLSEEISLFGKVPLKMSCIDTQITTTTYDLSYDPETLLVTSILDGVSGQVSVPVSSTGNGTIINVEMVLCNVAIQRCIM